VEYKDGRVFHTRGPLSGVPPALRISLSSTDFTVKHSDQDCVPNCRKPTEPTGPSMSTIRISAASTRKTFQTARVYILYTAWIGPGIDFAML